MKNDNLNKKSYGKGISLFRGLVLLLAVVSFIALIVIANRYLQSSKKVSDIRLKVDSQIELVAKLYPEYLRAVQGKTKRIRTSIQAFDAYTAEQQSQTNLHLLGSQTVRLNNVVADWEALKLSLLSLLAKGQKELPENAVVFDITLPNNIETVEKQIDQLRGALFELKSAYKIKTFSNHDPVLLMTVLAALSAALFFLWIIMQLRRNINLQTEANRLRVEAEQKSQNDQKAIDRLINDINGLSEGDLTVKAQTKEDFTKVVANSINVTIDNMRKMVGIIAKTSGDISQATEDTQSVSQLLKKSSEEQSQQITTTNKIAGSMSHLLGDIAETTGDAVEIAEASVTNAQEGRSLVVSTVKSMTAARENIQDTSKRIKRLGESSQEIGDIIEIIKSIADQTNVLALNAAIQATSAGEAGRGFAVVADEVQQLAERSAKATKQIEMLIKTIQADANEAILSMENSTAKVVTGANIAEKAGNSLDKIENGSQHLANIIVNVSDATRGAAGMAENVVGGMGSLSELNKNAVDDVRKSVQSIDDLKGLSALLKESVSGFRLPK
ncbi:MAG: hypothetical protein CR975_04030 [Gammaproteobacteria bacterium]|nr:MAG: hypothetical protein CR975_04030 [Gammaproteobacteria bacterium]